MSQTTLIPVDASSESSRYGNIIKRHDIRLTHGPSRRMKACLQNRQCLVLKITNLYWQLCCYNSSLYDWTLHLQICLSTQFRFTSQFLTNFYLFIRPLCMHLINSFMITWQLRFSCPLHVCLAGLHTHVCVI